MCKIPGLTLPIFSLIRHGKVGVVGAPPPGGHERRQLPVAELEPSHLEVIGHGRPASGEGRTEPQLPLQLGELLGSSDHVVVTDVAPASGVAHRLVHADVRLGYPLHVRRRQKAVSQHGVSTCICMRTYTQ
jgi:hypothetical protein